MKIQKFLSGGQPTFSVITDPFSAPVQQQSASSSGAASGSSSTDSLIDKNLLKEVADRGIQNDFEYLMDKMSNLQRKQDMGIQVSSAEYNGLLKDVNKVIRNGERFKNVVKHAESQDAFGEIAVGSSGQLYCYKNGQLESVSMAKYDVEKNGPALTVSDLIQLRETHPQLTFNQDVMETINSNLGMNKITDQIKTLIDAVGSTSDTQEAYVTLAQYIGKEAAKRPTQAQLQNLQDLAQAMHQLGPEAIFKNKQVLESKNLEEALAYISSILPRHVQLQLQGRFVAQGNDYKQSPSYMVNLLKTALASSNDYKVQDLISYESALSKDSGIKTETQKTRPQGTTEMFFNQNLDRTKVTITDPNYKNHFAIEVMGNVLPSLALDNGYGVGKAPLSEALTAGGKGMGKYLDQSKVWLGTDKVTSQYLDQVVYRGDQIANVWMPVDADGNIDWKSLHSYSEAEELIQSQNITDIDRKNQIHRQAGSPIQYNPDGSVQQNQRVEQFMMIHGYTSDDLLSSNNLMYKALDKSTTDLMDQEIKQINKQYKTKIQDSGWFTHLVETPIFIKIRPNAGLDASYYAGQGSQVPKTSLTEDMTSQLAHTMQYNPQDLNIPHIVHDSQVLYQQ